MEKYKITNDTLECVELLSYGICIFLKTGERMFITNEQIEKMNRWKNKMQFFKMRENNATPTKRI